jgi:hypothetical protein
MIGSQSHARGPLLAAALLLTAAAASCTQGTPLSPSALSADLATSLSQTSTPQACWGQATQVFARMREMGTHASAQANPRVGLRNLARDLYDMGVLPDDSLQALGAFVASALGLSIDSCL